MILCMMHAKKSILQTMDEAEKRYQQNQTCPHISLSISSMLLSPPTRILVHPHPTTSPLFSSPQSIVHNTLPYPSRPQISTSSLSLFCHHSLIPIFSPVTVALSQRPSKLIPTNPLQTTLQRKFSLLSLTHSLSSLPITKAPTPTSIASGIFHLLSLPPPPTAV